MHQNRSWTSCKSTSKEFELESECSAEIEMEKTGRSNKRVSIPPAAVSSVAVFGDTEVGNHEPAEEVDYTLGLPRPYSRHWELLKNLREVESQHVDPERFRYGVDGSDARVLTEPDAVIALHILELFNVSIRVTGKGCFIRNNSTWHA